MEVQLKPDSQFSKYKSVALTFDPQLFLFLILK